MQHNVLAAIFHLAQYSVCGSRRRGAARRVFYACRFSLATLNHHLCASCTATRTRYARQHGVRSACLLRFGEMFQ
jgi:hypothetical protein